MVALNVAGNLDLHVQRIVRGVVGRVDLALEVAPSGMLGNIGEGVIQAHDECLVVPARVLIGLCAAYVAEELDCDKEGSTQTAVRLDPAGHQIVL